MFPIACWNQYRRVIEERVRHNNYLESNNAKLKKLVRENPSVWDLMLGLRSAFRGDFQLAYNVSFFALTPAVEPS
jgi:hypothetical protein